MAHCSSAPAHSSSSPCPRDYCCAEKRKSLSHFIHYKLLQIQKSNPRMEEMKWNKIKSLFNFINTDSNLIRSWNIHILNLKLLILILKWSVCIRNERPGDLECRCMWSVYTMVLTYFQLSHLSHLRLLIRYSFCIFIVTVHLHIHIHLYVRTWSVLLIPSVMPPIVPIIIKPFQEILKQSVVSTHTHTAIPTWWRHKRCAETAGYIINDFEIKW